VMLSKPWRGRTKLAKMAAMATDEALLGVSREEWARIPLLLCIAEIERPGRPEELEELFAQLQTELGARFAPQSSVIAHGRVSVAVALARARALIEEDRAQRIVVVATDSLISWATLAQYARDDRLLSNRNSNGFMPGEGAGALLVGESNGASGELVCTGIGFAQETAHVSSDEPLRADGLTRAINAALMEAGRQMHDMDFRITDLSGEQYYFKEAALALSRVLRKHKEEFELWHPAECTGEQGAAVGATMIALVRSACQKSFARGPNILAHMANDAGQRAALSLQFRGAP